MKTTKLTTKLTAIGLLFAPFALSAIDLDYDASTETVTLTNASTTDTTTAFEIVKTTSTGGGTSIYSLDADVFSSSSDTVSTIIIGDGSDSSAIQFGAGSKSAGIASFNSAALGVGVGGLDIVVKSESSLIVKNGTITFNEITIESGASMSQSGATTYTSGGTLTGGTITNYGTYKMEDGVLSSVTLNNYGTFTASTANPAITSTILNNYATMTLSNAIKYTSVAINSIGDATTTINAGTFSDSSFSGNITISGEGVLTLSGTTSIYLDVNSTSDYESILFGSYVTNSGDVALYLDFSDFTAVEGDVLDLSSLVDLYDDFSGYSAVYVDGVEVEDFDSDITLDNGYSLNLSNSSITVSGTAVPEPSTYAMIFGVVALGFAAYRRRK